MTFLQGRVRVATLLVAVATAAFISACGSSTSPYVFSAVLAEIPLQGEAIIDVRIMDTMSGKPVANAVIFETRFDMSPDGMGSMTAPVEAQSPPTAGTYRFKVSPTMAGRWALTLSAKVQGVDETIIGTVVVTAR